MGKTCAKVAISHVQKVIAVLEDVSGELQPPVSEGGILPVGRASMMQTPTFSNSEELSPSLNILDQFQNAVPAGTGSISLFGRLDSNYGKPEGDALFTALMGDYNDPAKFSCKAAEAVSADATEIPVKDIVNDNMIEGNILAGKLPPRGIIRIGTEKICYRAIKQENGKTILANCRRGYGITEKADIEADADVHILSRTYTQSVCRPTLSIYILNDDKLCLFMSGCSITQANVRLQRENGQQFTFDFQGRRMGWCGCGELAEDCTGTQVKLTKGGTDAFTAGGYIRNATLGETSGIKIAYVDDARDTLILASAVTGWLAGHKIKPWLPEVQEIGTAIESRFANVEVAGIAGKMGEGGLTVQTPVSNVQEIGDEYVGEGVDGKRTITLERTIHLRTQDCREFGRGYKGYELPVSVFCGKDAGSTLCFHMPRVKFGTPELGESDQWLTLKQNGAALGVTGEDALFIIQE